MADFKVGDQVVTSDGVGTVAACFQTGAALVSLDNGSGWYSIDALRQPTDTSFKVGDRVRRGPHWLNDREGVVEMVDGRLARVDWGHSNAQLSWWGFDDLVLVDAPKPEPVKVEQPVEQPVTVGDYVEVVAYRGRVTEITNTDVTVEDEHGGSILFGTDDDDYEIRRISTPLPRNSFVRHRRNGRRYFLTYAGEVLLDEVIAACGTGTRQHLRLSYKSDAWSCKSVPRQFPPNSFVRHVASQQLYFIGTNDVFRIDLDGALCADGTPADYTDRHYELVQAL